ncbi:hypothetical protein M495_20265 [Serratia liquefaciens ATCC 27592]|nr:hypothetical protein M495_20265 [Serratia liquefaciens ATCC 27592]
MQLDIAFKIKIYHRVTFMLADGFFAQIEFP